MDNYISKDKLMAYLEPLTNTPAIVIKRYVENMPCSDLYEKKTCRMIPHEPDMRNCTNLFICTNCHQFIRLGFITENYSGFFCLKCGAEVKEGD